MSAVANLADPYAAEAFFALARERLHRDPPNLDNSISIHTFANPAAQPLHFTSYRDAAVLIPVVSRGRDTRVLLTVRHADLSSHAGQVAFPGGKIDAGDNGPADAAMREAWEEIGLDRAKVTPIGYLDSYLTGTGFRVVPVLARVDPDHELLLNPGEVTAAFEVPLSFLMEPANHALKSRQRDDGGIHYFYEMPFEGFRIWGITAGIIRGLYERVYR